MLTQEEDVEIHALKKRGWSISEIARHIGRDRKTVRAYLSGERHPGVRVNSEPDPFDRIEAYVAQRLADDHGVWGTTLFDEVQALGYDRSYPTFTRKLRQRQLRPHCEACSGVKGRATVVIDHPCGCRDPVGLGRTRCLSVGSDCGCVDAGRSAVAFVQGEGVALLL